MAKVRFTADVSVKDHNGEVEFSAKDGESVELSERSATRWIRRGLAVEAGADPEPDPSPATEAEPARKVTRKKASRKFDG